MNAFMYFVNSFFSAGGSNVKQYFSEQQSSHRTPHYYKQASKLNQNPLQYEQYNLPSLAQRARDGDMVSTMRLADILLTGTDDIPKDIPRAIELFDQAANSGDKAQVAEANYKLGVIYRDGLMPDQKSPEKALVHFKLAADLDHTGSMLAIAAMYRDGDGMNQDDVVAVSWLRRANDLRDSKAKFNLGIHYSEGRGVKADDKMALEWFIAAARDGDSEACFYTAKMHEEGKGTPKDLKLAVNWYQRGANYDHPGSMANLASYYVTGEGGLWSDCKKALELLEKAAALSPDDPVIAAKLAVMYAEGVDIPRNIKKAVACLEKLSQYSDKYSNTTQEYSDRERLYEVGTGYFYGTKVTQNDEVAFAFLKNAALRGHQEAMCLLAFMYQTGRGTGQNTEQALAWLEKSQDDVDEVVFTSEQLRGLSPQALKAQIMFAIGDKCRNVPEIGWKQAMSWFDSAAKLGNIHAMYALGHAFYGGEEGVPDNEEAAMKFFIAAANGGKPDAMNRLAQIYANQNNDNEALAWFEKYVNSSPPNTITQPAGVSSLATMYCTFGDQIWDMGVVNSVEASLPWYQKAAELNHPKAILRVGQVNLRDRPEFGMGLITKAANAGCLEAIHQLGCHYANGEYIKQDNKAALELIIKAANAGYIRAMHELGNVYCQGGALGVQVDRDQAFNWYKKTAEAKGGNLDERSYIADSKHVLKKEFDFVA